MIHFNELGLSEDGKQLIVDVSVDADPIYRGVYIDKVYVDLCSNLTTGSDVSNNAVLVYTPDEVILGDFNLDGEVNTQDYSVLADIQQSVIRNDKFDVDDPYLAAALGVENDGEIGISDLQAIRDVLDDAVLNGAHTMVPVKKHHVRLCLNVSGEELDSLVGDSTSGLFMVKVVAAGGNYEEFERMGCGWDVANIYGVAYNGKPLYDAAVRYASSYGNTCNDNDASALEDFILRYYSFMLALKCGDIKQACYYYNNYLSGNAVVSGKSGNGCGCHGTY